MIFCKEVDLMSVEGKGQSVKDRGIVRQSDGHAREGVCHLDKIKKLQ